MHFEVWAKGLATLSVDCIVLGVFEEGELPDEAQTVDTAAGGWWFTLFTAVLGSVILLGLVRVVRPRSRL